MNWQPIETAPKDGRYIWVAFHGHGESRAAIVSWAPTSLGRHGNWDYINSHDGQPQWWMPLERPTPPEGMDGPHCMCDGCVERHYEEVPTGNGEVDGR
jgi:hypothetical protein